MTVIWERENLSEEPPRGHIEKLPSAPPMSGEQRRHHGLSSPHSTHIPSLVPSFPEALRLSSPSSQEIHLQRPVLASAANTANWITDWGPPCSTPCLLLLAVISPLQWARSVGCHGYGASLSGMLCLNDAVHWVTTYSCRGMATNLVYQHCGSKSVAKCGPLVYPSSLHGIQ